MSWPASPGSYQHATHRQGHDYRRRRRGRARHVRTQLSFIRAAHAGAISAGRAANTERPDAKAAKLVERFACDAEQILRFTTDTAARITLLIGRLFHLRYTLRGTSYLLHRNGFTVQIPARRAAEREGPITTWRSETWATTLTCDTMRIAGQACDRRHKGSWRWNGESAVVGGSF